MKILIVQQKMIGDVLTSTILCEQIKKNIPDSQVHYLINENTVAVVANNPYIDQIVLFKQEYRNDKLALYRFLKTIRKENYDVVIDVYSKLESMLITLFSGAKIKISYYKWYSKSIYTHTHKYVRSGNTRLGLAIENRLALLTPILSIGELRIDPPKIYLDPTEIEAAKTFLAQKGVDFSKPNLMINVLGSSSNKTYPPTYMAAILDRIAQRSPSNILFNYIPSQIAEVQEVYGLCAPNTQQMIRLDIFAPSLRSFLGLLTHCNALLGNEGGGVNMAKALNLPTFSIFSPWVTKVAWEIFPENKMNKAVHLGDFLPEHFQNRSVKQLQEASEELLYPLFLPSLFIDQLDCFLNDQVFTHQ